MKTTFIRVALTLLVVLIFSFGKAKSQAVVLPTTTGVNLFCQGADLQLPAPPTNENWIVKYSATQTTTPTTGVTLTSNKITAADLATGYYYLSSKSSVEGSCESALQEIPVYVLKPLIVDITPTNFCIEATPIKIAALITNPENANISTLAYQWYTIDASNVEHAIAGETTIDFTPSGTLAVGTTKYRLKVGYVIGGNKYCPAVSADKILEITAKPTKPTITVEQIGGNATPATF
jgi:hypothetical protein